MIVRFLAVSPLFLFGASVPPAPVGPPVPKPPETVAPIARSTLFSSGMACEFPVRWRIADVDPAFGITTDEAARAVREAGILWETAVQRVLLFQESADGIPISFVFDERQQATIERQRRIAAIESGEAAVEEAEAEIRSLRSRLGGRRTVHNTRQADYNDRLQSYEQQVEYWNRVGGAPPEELARLRITEAEIEEARQAVNASATEVNDLVDEINAATDRVNSQISRLNDARAELETGFPATQVQSGQYLEDRRGFGRITLSRDIEIRIYQFENRDHLIQVLAHELGHAMGLEHNEEEGSLMGDEVVPVPEGGRAAIQPSDAARLLELCPDL